MKLASVSGRRFSFFQRFDIIDPLTQMTYLRRWYLINTPWFGIFLHHILSADPDRDVHDHPWNFWSLVLLGGYKEERKPAGTKSWFSPSIHYMQAEDAHRIIRTLPRTWTLLFVGPRRREWGFWTADGWVQWKTYIDRIRERGVR